MPVLSDPQCCGHTCQLVATLRAVCLCLHHRRPFIREVRLKKDYSDYEDVANCEFNIEFVDSNKG